MRAFTLVVSIGALTIGCGAGPGGVISGRSGSADGGVTVHSLHLTNGDHLGDNSSGSPDGGVVPTDASTGATVDGSVATGGGPDGSIGVTDGSIGVTDLATKVVRDGGPATTDASASAGALSFSDRSQQTGVGSAGAGIPWLFDVTMEDFDGDGYQDVLLGSHVAGGAGENDSSVLLFASPSGPFTVANRPPTKAEVWSQMAVDFDNDGLEDIGFNWDSGLFATTVLHNKGARTFEALSPGATFSTQANSMAWADWDGDGRADYMIGGFHGNALYRFTAGSYVDVTATRSPISDTSYTQGSLYLADLDGDGWPDILTQPYAGGGNSGIFTESTTHTTQVYFNNGKTGAAAGFKAGVTAGLDGCPAPGLSLGDFNNDGWLDVLCIGSSPTAGRSVFQSRLYLNNGNGTFTDVSQGSGLPQGDSSTNPYTVIYLASAFEDFDNDGLLDIFWFDYGADGAKLYRNLGNGKFGDITAAAGLAGINGDRPSRFALGDYDNDGAIDIVTATSPNSSGGTATLMHNDLRGGSFLKVRLTGTKIKNAIGSKIYLYAGGHIGDPKFLLGYRELTLAHSHRHPLEQHFGVAAGRPYDLRVHYWPDGTQVDVTGVASGSRVRIDESGTRASY